MKILCWNVRGFNAPDKHSAVLKKVRRLHLDIIAIIETRVAEANSVGILTKQFSQLQNMNNYPKSPNGRVWLLWKEGLKITKVEDGKHFLKVKVWGVIPFMLMVVYSPNKEVERSALYKDLLSHKDSLPMVVFGDFNAVLSPRETSNLDVMNPSMVEFQT
ncbi:unnamed protein product [Linum trigynum]|uniref:Endonuclease/exonuclease/phosphatase domain-containing protein n=1 Tax=Linum trigynum TaxID=586398 RepID=A0AAV2CR99_9ROSI